MTPLTIPLPCRRQTVSILLSLFIGPLAGQTLTAVTNGADFVPESVSPGSIAILWGTNLSATTAHAPGTSLPTQLAGVTVNLDGVAVPLYYVSPTQIDFQVPYGALGSLPSNLAYINLVGSAGPSGNQLPFAISRTAPGIFTDGSGRAIAQNADYSVNTANNPASSTSYITVYITGIGGVDQPVADGQPAPNAPLSRATAPVSATIGGVSTNVAFAGLTPGFTGLAQANIQVPDLPSGTYPLILTVGYAASNAASVTIAGGARTPSAVLTSIVGEGVTGNPQTASTPYPPQTPVSYSYAATSGFSAPVVEVDGTVSPGSGTIAMNVDHWLWSFGQPLTGVDFPGYITAPADPTKIPYPQFFLNQPSSLTVRIANPYCALQSGVTAYPLSFLGKFPMPAVTGAPLPSSISRGVNLKDFWHPPGQFSATLNSACSDSMHDAFTDSVARIRRMGADHVSVVATPVIVDANGKMVTAPSDGQPVLLNPAWPGAGIAESDMAFIANTAAQAGLEPWLDLQVCCVSSNPPSAAWFSSFLDAYTQYVVQTAQMAEKYGFKSIMLNWGAWNAYNLAPFGDLYPAKMAAALAQLRKVFSGTVRLYHWGGANLNDAAFAALYRSVDAIQVEFDAPVLSAQENQNLTFSLVKQKYKHLLAGVARQFLTAFPSKKIAFYALIQSHRDFLQTGWIEDAFCVNGCVQKTLQTDFSVQAIAYEALLEAVAESGIDFLSFDTKGYWYADNILPEDSFPNIAQSVRNKPAEVVLERWYHR